MLPVAGAAEAGPGTSPGNDCMRKRTNINGFIFGDTEDDKHNLQVLEDYPYACDLPLRPIFSQPVPGYMGSMIAFADSVRAERADWDGWRAAFELFLSKLKWREARLTLAAADALATERYAYMVIERGPEGTRAIRLRLEPGVDEMTETELVL